MDPLHAIQEFIRNKLSFKPGDTIFREGGQAGYVFVILQGKVRIKKASPRGLVSLAVLDKGQVLGETSFFDTAAKLRSTTAVAETEVVLGVLNNEKLRQEMTKISSIQQEILAGLARRIRVTTTNAALMAGS